MKTNELNGIMEDDEMRQEITQIGNEKEEKGRISMSSLKVPSSITMNVFRIVSQYNACILFDFV